MRNGFDTIFQLVQNDYGQVLAFTLQDSAGVTVDISNATLQFIAQLDSNDAVAFSQAMQIINAMNGQCTYTVQQGDFSIPGTWNVQIQVTYNAGEILTFSDITVTVEAELPIS